MFFLFFVLRDGRRFPGWLARAGGWNEETAEGIARESQTALRGYFRGIAITALVTAPSS
ncbi:hypothetical protein G7085_10180 [Tessaracoccus sp. HDW20]|uniref:hypothetical protein n=1 Tax=Tessaracoccus coleopterorum TaxID=2714950 RepID=UPI0018D48339|nr:hypothetical protein [Tessaracoccus coleopterorum]NHB84843.1 hypothetical protein [Tessaracoccus coleopterorum]